MRGVERRDKEVSASLKIMLSLPITCSFPVDKSFSFYVPGMVPWWHRVFFGDTGFRYCSFTSRHHPFLPFLLPPKLIPAPVPLHVTAVFISQHLPSSIISLLIAETVKYIFKKKKKDFVRCVWNSYTIWFMEQCTTEGRPSGRWRWHKGLVRKMQKRQAPQTLLPPHSSYWQTTASISALNSSERMCHESLLKDVCKVLWDPYRYNAEKCPWRAEISVLTLQDLLGRK